MAIKFSQFITQTSASSLSHIVGYNGADNLQITPANFFTSFAVGNTGQVSYFDSASSLEGSNEFVWDSSNNRLGIGTSSPLGKLQVNKYTVGSQGNQTIHGELSVFANNGDESLFLGVRDAAYPNRGWAFNPVITGVNSDLQIKEHGSSGVRMRITTAGNVGIGTASPSAKLEVDGTLVATGISQLGSSGANVYLTSSSAGNVGIGTSSPGSKLEVNGLISGKGGAGWGYTFSGDLDTSIENPSANTISFKTTGLERMRIDSSGNVGIGTTSPGYKLDIEGDSSSGVVSVKNAANGRDTFRSENAAGTRTLNFGNDGSGHGLFIVRDSAGAVTNYITGSGNSYFNAGNVGIGTTSPGAKLQITGSTSDTTALAFITRNSSNISLFSIRNDGRIDVAGATVFATSVQSPFFTSDGGRGFKQDSVAFVGTYSNGSDANGVNDLGSTTNKWRDIYITGDITSSAGGATFAGDITTNGDVIIDNSSGDPFLKLKTTAKEFVLRIDQSDNEKFQIRDVSNSATRFTINNSGNVGIGITSPVAKLHVYQNNSDDDTTAGVTIEQDGTGDAALSFLLTSVRRWRLGIDNNDFDKFKISDSTNLATSNKLTIDVDGNVGIGTSSPDNRLDVVVSDVNVTPNSESSAVFRRNGNNYISILSNSNNFGGILFGEETDANDGALSYDHPNGNMIFETRDAERMRINSTGDVGIGTTPHTAGNTWRSFYVGSSATIISRQAASGTDAMFGNNFYINSSNVDKRITTGGASRLFMNQDVIRFQRSATAATDTTISWSESMRIDSSGNVLFGTTGIPDGTSVYGSGFIPESDDRATLFLASSRTTAAALIIFKNPNGTAGSISTSGTSTSFNTSSDYRLKKDLKDFDGLDKVSKIPVYDFKWKVDDSSSYGVMAHELQEVLPDAVSGEKDGEEMQGVDYSKIVPLLIKSIQELKAEVEDLKSKI